MNSSDTNLENQNTEIKNSKKSNKGLVIILILIILGLGGYICYDKIIMKEDSNKVVDKEEENKEEDKTNSETKELIVSNPEIVSKLTEKIDLLITHESYLNYIEDWTIYTDLNLSDRTKLLIALENSDSLQFPADDPENDGYDHILTKNSIEYVYEKLWGEEIKNFENFNTCPSYEFKSEIEKYHIMGQCGDVVNNYLLSYVSKVTEGKGAYYLYQSVGMVDYIDDNDNWGGKLYDSVDMKKVIVEGDDVVDFEINENNKEKFSEYRFTFKLDNGVYKITNIERLK